MIKNFSVFYVGNIDLEDVGLDGIPAMIGDTKMSV